MPRILVADDNSNIQKMVVLAFKDAGIEVIAVGNGEAAIRKLPEVNPDLVLADIFMPVRNGYEVCEFIKHDPRYMHTAVVLMVGAFDPLDEREAQRVQADGVLKKPFLPPDPLINMVNALLAKSASERPVAVAVAVPAAVAHHEAGHAPMTPQVPPAAEFTDAPPTEFAMPSVQLNEGDQPVAFSSLFEMAPAESDSAETAVTATRDPSLGEPSFWSPPEETEEAPAGESSAGYAWETEADALPRREEAARLRPIELTLDSEREESGSTQIEDRLPRPGAPKTPDEPCLAHDEPDAKTSLDAQSVADLPDIDQASPSDESISPASPVTSFREFTDRATSVADVPPTNHSTDASFHEPLAMEPARSVETISFHLEPPSERADVSSVELEQESEPEPQFMPNAPLLWRDDPSSLPEHISPMETTSPTPAVAETEPDTSIESPVAPLETASAQGDSAGNYEDDVVPALDATPAIAPFVAEAVADSKQVDPRMIEAIVERVIERMQPKIIEIVTREILRPVVEALVQREILKR